MIDSRNVMDLCDQVVKKWGLVAAEMERLGTPVALVSTFRDWEMQDYLYSQGRTRAGKIITWVTAGGSFHNVRRAVDAWPLNPETGKLDGYFVNTWEAVQMFRTLGRVGKEFGFQWGGDWTGGKTDRPHLQDGYCSLCDSVFATARHFDENGNCGLGRG